MYFAVLAFILVAVWWLSSRGQASMSNKRVFITGCDSGFGELMALHYCEEGAHVFAGVLTQENGQSLESRAAGKGTLTSIILNVTDSQQFKDAFSRVESALNGSALDVLICNAGILKGWVVELTTEEEFQQVMDVNFMGCVRAIQTFLPLIRQPDGRIIGITSVASFIAARGMSSYNCSKFAQGALLETLRRELRQCGIHVIQICPGFFNTAILTSHQKDITFQERYNRASENVKGRYGALPEDSAAAMSIGLKIAKNPMIVVKQVRRAMLDRRPVAKMLVGLDAKIFWWISLLPAFIQDPIWLITAKKRPVKNKNN